MKMRVLAAGLAMMALWGGLAMAQTNRPAGQIPAQIPSLTVAPASAADVAALQTRLAQLEAAHNATRTELAQTRLQLQSTQTRLGALVDGVHRYANCERQRVAYANGSAAAVPVSGCGSLFDNLNHLSNTQ